MVIPIYIYYFGNQALFLSSIQYLYVKGFVRIITETNL